MIFKVADGSEGATISVDLSAAIKGATITWRLTGVDTTNAFVCEASAATTTTSANIDPASFTPTQPGGAQDYLWLSVIGMDSETATASNGTLSNVTSANSGTAGAVATNCIIWGGSKQENTATENVAAWTSSAPASGAAAFTLAIYPAAAAGGFVDNELLIALQAVSRSTVY